MKKMNFWEVARQFEQHNEDHNIDEQYGDKTPLIGVAVFAQSNFVRELSLAERSYQFRSDEKFFVKGNYIGNSIFARRLSDKEEDRTCYNIADDIRGFNNMKVEYCYILNEKEVK